MTRFTHHSIPAILLLLGGCLFATVLPLKAQFVPDDIQVGATGVSYSDPEFHSGTSRVVFQNSSAGVPRVWIGEINPATGAFVSANGQDLLVDTAVATLGPTAQTNNGPEWGEDSGGVAVFYSKPDGSGLPQVFRATNLTAGAVTVNQMTSVTGPTWATNATVRQDASLPTTKFFYRYAAGPSGTGPSRWADETAPTLANTLPGLNTAAFAPSWIPGIEELVYSRFTGPTTSELYRYSTTSLTGSLVTNEPAVAKQNIVAFNAPEFNNELCYACVVDVSALAIYRNLGSGYTRVATLTAGNPALPYMYSPEIFQAGGVTYFAVVMQNSANYLTATEGAIYVLGLGADAGNRLVRRIDSGTAANRFEPEVLVGSSEVFVYFNIGGQLRRARTGVSTQPLAIANVPGTELAVTRGLPYALTLPVSGGVAPYSWQVTGGSLPTGLTLTASGVVSGTPTQNGTFSYTVRATDSEGATFNKTLSVKVADGFAPNAPFIGQQGGSYADPEFNETASQVTFMDTDRTLWVGDLDPQTATFVTATGRDYQMDTNLSYIIGTPGLNAKYATNGPEWVRDGTGWAVAYTKEDPQGIQQQWKAKVINGQSVITQLTTDAQDCYGNAPSRFDDGLPPRVAFNYRWPITQAKLGWIFVNDPTNIHVIEGFDPFQMSMWSSVSSDFGYVHLPPGSTTGQIGRLNADTNVGQVLTNDEGSKNDPGFFLAPEFGGELCMVARVDNTSLGVYRNLNAPDGYWTRIATLRLPAGNTHKYIFSTEILAPQTGIGGVTYFAVNAADVNEWSGGDRSIWVLGLGTDPNKRFVRRVDDGALTGVASGRLEPEPYTATDQAFVFYSYFGLRRAATGIFKSALGITDPAGSMPAGAVGSAFSYQFTGSGGVLPYTWSLASGTVPAGLTLSSAGLLSGTPAGAGTYDFTVQSTDERGVSVTRQITLTVAAAPWSGPPSAYTRMKFARDYIPGTYDVNGQFMGGTATMFLTPHQGKLWAGIGYWNDVPATDPTPGPQILVKDAFDAPWKVDFSFGTGYLRVDGMRSVTFTTDRLGNGLNPPVTMLMAAVSDVSPPQETTVWTRAENTNVWTKTTLGSGLYARMIFDHKDKVTGIHHVFAADESSALYRGGYDATAPGRLVWHPVPEITGPQRMLSAAVANGDLYLGVATDGNPTNNYGGIFKRVDGASPSWQFVYEWPRTGTLDLGSNLRGLTAIPDPNGGGHQVLIGVLENLKQIVRIDPMNGNSVTVELDLEAYFDGKWGSGAIFYYAAYNDMLPITDPKTGEPQHLIGVWARHPDATNTRNFNNTWYLIRHANGTYEHTQVIDPAIPIPAYPGLWAVRTIVPSPFPQETGRVLYLGGADAGGGANPENPNTQWHNTAWIYRATRPDENMGLTKTGSSATVGLDTVHGWNYQLQYSLNLASWINLGTAFPGNNAVQQSVQNVGTQQRVFFRAGMTKTTP